jgi:hypothetical protein
MITDSSVEIEAPPGLVWDVFADVVRWPEWTASVTTLVALDGPALEVGRRFEIKQPRMPKLVWQVTELDPGVSWSWEQRSPGGVTVASHWVTSSGDGRTRVEQRIDQRGPVGVVVGALMRRLTRKYLELEAQGLKTASEGLRRADGSSA